MSVVVVATFRAHPEYREEVLGILAETIARTHAEDAGCLLYALHQGDDRFVMVEKWASREALDAHSAGAAVADMRPRLEGRLTEPVDVQVLRAVPAGTDGQGLL